MSRASPAQDLERRIPRQQRAQESCEAIFAATARLLRQDGAAALSTNRIAEVAGLSIGTLYQYFPNKQAILLALGRREVARIRALAAAQAEGEAEGVALRRLLAGFMARRAERRVLGETLFSPELQTELAEAIAGALASPAPSFVLSRAVLGVLRAVVLEEEPPEAAALEREVLALAQAEGEGRTALSGC